MEVLRFFLCTPIVDSFVDLEKPEKMRIWLQNFVSIQPRTSLEKSDVSWPTMAFISALLRGTGQQGSPSRFGHDTSLFLKLVLGWIETKFCNQIRIFSGFSRSTKLSSWFFEKVAKFAKNRKKFAIFFRNFRIFAKKSVDFCENRWFCKILQNSWKFSQIVL